MGNGGTKNVDYHHWPKWIGQIGLTGEIIYQNLNQHEVYFDFFIATFQKLHCQQPFLIYVEKYLQQP